MARAMRAPGSLKPKAIRAVLRPGRVRQGQAPGLPALPAPGAAQARWSRAAGAAVARSAMRSTLDHAGAAPYSQRPGPARPGPARPGPARPQASGHAATHGTTKTITGNSTGALNPGFGGVCCPQSGVCGWPAGAGRGWAGAGRGRAGPGWAGPGWAGRGGAGLGRAGPGRAGPGGAGPGGAGLGRARPGGAGLGWAGATQRGVLASHAVAGDAERGAGLRVPA